MTEDKRFKQVVNGVKDTRTGRTLTYPLEVTMKLNEINTLYDIVFDRNEELEKENEELKQELAYIQNSITEHIKHQKTELGQKALKEIIEDYNEWLLGHKEL